VDHENPPLCTAKPSADRASITDVIARIAVILGQELGPAEVPPHAFAADHRRVEVGLKQARARQTLKYR
jgi:hypothetical protein